jgi:hypothetical protein
MYAIELAGAIGPTGPSGTANTTSFTSPVVITATTTSPTTGTRTMDSTSALVLGDTMRITLRLGYPGSATGSGDYLFKLPSGVSFNTAAGFNPIYTGGPWVFTDLSSLAPYMIPANGRIIINTNWSATVFIIPYSSTTYRILADAFKTNSNLYFLGSGYYQMTYNSLISLEFNIWV